DGPAARIGDAHRHADNAAFVERRVPRRLESLRGGENTTQRRPDVFPEDVGDAEVRLAVMESQTNSLNECCHVSRNPPGLSWGSLGWFLTNSTLETIVRNPGTSPGHPGKIAPYQGKPV